MSLVSHAYTYQWCQFAIARHLSFPQIPLAQAAAFTMLSQYKCGESRHSSTPAIPHCQRDNMKMKVGQILLEPMMNTPRQFPSLFFADAFHALILRAALFYHFDVRSSTSATVGRRAFADAPDTHAAYGAAGAAAPKRWMLLGACPCDVFLISRMTSPRDLLMLLLARDAAAHFSFLRAYYAMRNAQKSSAASGRFSSLRTEFHS